MMLTAVILLTVGTGCKGNDPKTREVSYSLNQKDELGVSGTVTFTETSNASTTIEIKVSGSAIVGSHPVKLFKESIVENGALSVELNPIDVNGTSTTIVPNMTYSQLSSYDGCIKVFKSESESSIILAQGDIGGNVITSTNKKYTLQGTVGVSGTALFEKRVNGNTLVTIDLDNTITDKTYPATINVGSVTTAGDVKITLNPVNGSTGKSLTNIRKKDDNSLIQYSDLLVFTGYISIYQSSINSGIVVCNGNIGTNVTK